MKQMSLIEMDGFLKGKCIPSDLKVNETNAEYLVRKFAEAEAKISALSEDHQKAIESIKQADSAVKLAHEKFSALAAENAGLKSDAPLGAIENGRAFADRLENYQFECEGGNLNMCSDWQEFRRCFEYLSEWVMHSQTEHPATDAFLAEIERKAIRKFINSIEHILRDKLSPYDTEEMLEAMRIFLEEQEGEQK
ncbi:TPA: hNH endonuclease [Escherichia coli]|nr:hNH endonuclease [Escherichia coli]HCO0342134.1 hNH endonuclease [Escherichia coli]